MATLLLLLLGVTPLSAEDAWEAALRRARSEQKVILAYAKPASCAEQACVLDRHLAHPALQRRLDGLIFVTRPSSDGVPAISVHDPSGAQWMAWRSVRRPSDLSKLLTLVEVASSDILAASRASRDGNDALSRRHRALAVLSLGDASRGRAVLEEMQASGDREDRELASLWLDAYRAQTEGAERDETLLAAHAKNGSTNRVRLEAVMALARLRTAAGRFDDAIRLYGQAVELASDDTLRDLARRERQRAADQASPFVGLGEIDMLVAGRRTVQPRSVVRGAANVQYLLDGRRVAASARRPFTASIDFGRSPRRQVLEFVALDQKGRELQRGGVAVNERSDAFEVRITQPVSPFASGKIAVAASATVPRGRRIEWLAVEWNGKAVARLHAPPFETSIDVADGEEGVLRAVVRLDDGAETEDVRLLNAGAVTLTSRVHLVELPVHVTGEAPRAKDVVVLENGKRREVERVIPAADAPLRIALLLDSSASMDDHLFDLQESAIRFAEQHLGDDDRAMVVAFGTGRGTLWPTADHDVIARMILRQQAYGGTALFDALITGLLNVQSAGCRRAIVVFTDGVDTSSTFTFDDVHTVARRMAIPIYVLLFRPAGLRPTDQYKLTRAWRKFAEETGGRLFSLDSLDEIGATWTEIARDLERQSLVVFRTDPSLKSWRTLEVRAPGFSIRAPKGIDVLEEPAEAKP